MLLGELLLSLLLLLLHLLFLIAAGPLLALLLPLIALQLPPGSGVGVRFCTFKCHFAHLQTMCAPIVLHAMLGILANVTL